MLSLRFLCFIHSRRALWELSHELDSLTDSDSLVKMGTLCINSSIKPDININSHASTVMECLNTMLRWDVKNTSVHTLIHAVEHPVMCSDKYYVMHWFNIRMQIVGLTIQNIYRLEIVSSNTH